MNFNESRIAITCVLTTGAMLLAGCGETHELTLYMQNLEVEGPIAQPPVVVTKDPKKGEVHIIPRVSFSTQRNLEGRIEGHTPVDAHGVFQVDTVWNQNHSVLFRDPGNVNTRPSNGRNLQWKVPAASFGLDVDLGVSETISLVVGATYSSAGSSGVVAYRAGLGFRGRNDRETIGWRLDLGWLWQEHAYEALTVVTDRPLSSSSSLVSFYLDEKKQTSGNFYGALTVNSIRPDWPINILVQAGVSKQSISKIEPRVLAPQPWIFPPYYLDDPFANTIVVDKRGKFSPTMIHLMPAGYMNITESAALVFGLRFSLVTGIDDLSSGLVLSPVVQIDWEL